jgi:4-aminobutyrate aminotransferase
LSFLFSFDRKGIANGHVLSGIASTYDLMQKQPAGSMGGTYAGNVVSCAAACATLDVLERDKVPEKFSQKKSLF